jgi:hypothetical protein
MVPENIKSGGSLAGLIVLLGFAFTAVLGLIGRFFGSMMKANSNKLSYIRRIWVTANYYGFLPNATSYPG